MASGSEGFQGVKDLTQEQMDAQMQGEEDDRVQEAIEVQSWFLDRMRSVYQAPR